MPILSRTARPVPDRNGHRRLWIRQGVPLAAVSRCNKLSYQTGKWSIRVLRPKCKMRGDALHTATEPARLAPTYGGVRCYRSSCLPSVGCSGRKQQCGLPHGASPSLIFRPQELRSGAIPRTVRSSTGQRSIWPCSRARSVRRNRAENCRSSSRASPRRDGGMSRQICLSS